MVSFISNTNTNHKAILIDLMNRSDEIIIAVGFLKYSGFELIREDLKLFCASKNKKVTFYIGLGFGETEPLALKDLYKIICKNPQNRLFLCVPDAGIFHPKVYVFRTGEELTIIIGSANLTANGWKINDEVSIMFDTTIKSEEYKQLMSYFCQLDQKYASKDIGKLIEKYSREKSSYDDRYEYKPKFEFKIQKSSVKGIDMPMLEHYFKMYIPGERDYIDSLEREDAYQQAKRNLNKLASDKPLSQSEVSRLFGQLVGHKEYKPKLWNSGSIHRHTRKTLSNPGSLRELVRTIKQFSKLETGIAFEKSMTTLNQMKKQKRISGIGENIVTEILMTFEPDKFANLNDNPLRVLKEAGKVFPAPTGFNSKVYVEYVELLIRIRNRLNMSTFLEIDSFFNFIYWYLKNNN